MNGFANWKRSQSAAPHVPALPIGWPEFVEQVRAKLNAAERAFLDRAVAKRNLGERQAIAELGVDEAIAQLRNEMPFEQMRRGETPSSTTKFTRKP